MILGQCEARYVGLTSQRSIDRIKQHVLESIKAPKREQPSRIWKNQHFQIQCDSEIGKNLFTNPECAKTYSDDSFKIIGQAKSPFHLEVSESVYIKRIKTSVDRKSSFCLLDSSTRTSATPN